MRQIVLLLLITLIASCSNKDIDDTLEPAIPNIPYTLVSYSGTDTQAFASGEIIWQFDLLENVVTITNNALENLEGLLFTGAYPLFLDDQLLFVNGEFGYTFRFEDQTLILTSIPSQDAEPTSYELRFIPL